MLHKCECCKQPVTIGGDDEEGTHYYISKYPAKISDKTRCPLCGGMSLVKIMGRKIAFLYAYMLLAEANDWIQHAFEYSDREKEATAFKEAAVKMNNRVETFYGVEK